MSDAKVIVILWVLAWAVAFVWSVVRPRPAKRCPRCGAPEYGSCPECYAEPWRRP